MILVASKPLLICTAFRISGNSDPAYSSGEYRESSNKALLNNTEVQLHSKEPVTRMTEETMWEEVGTSASQVSQALQRDAVHRDWIDVERPGVNNRDVVRFPLSSAQLWSRSREKGPRISITCYDMHGYH